jgi:hypothetical protein
MRMARKPSAVARELLKNFPKGGRRRRRRKRGNGNQAAAAEEAGEPASTSGNGAEPDEAPVDAEEASEPSADEVS